MALMICSPQSKLCLLTTMYTRSITVLRKVVLDRPGPADSFRMETVDFDSSASLSPNYVRVQVAATAVAYRDLIDRKGGFPFMNQPTVLGHEIAGVVEASANSNFKKGDHVVSLHWAQMGGLAFPSPFMNQEGMKTFLGLTCDGGYSDYVTTHGSAFVHVNCPHKWSAVEAAPVMSTFGTVWQGAVVRGGLKAGETVLVTGAAGGVGSSAVMMATRLGAHVIGTTGDMANKKDYILKLGAQRVVEAKVGFSKAVGVEGVDMVIECVGAPTFNDSLRSLKPGGRLVLIGNVSNASVQLPLGLCIVKSLSVIGTDSIETDELRKLFTWLEKENIRPVVDRVLPLDSASVTTAHELLEGRSISGRIVLDVNKSIW
jgi:acryloyl-coenzyme A reductase